MKRVVDSSAWIEWLAGGPIARRLKAELPKREDWIVPTLVQLEIAKWLTRERGEEAAASAIAFSMKCRVVPLDTPLALAAAGLCRTHRLPTADAVIYATAMSENAELVTCEAHFSGLPGVCYVEKAR